MVHVLQLHYPTGVIFSVFGIKSKRIKIKRARREAPLFLYQKKWRD